jgi:hypothetical protein
MRAAIAVAAVLVSGSALAWGPFDSVKGNGKIVEQTREVGAFREVGIPMGIQATIRRGDTPSVKLIGDENLLALLEVRVEDGELEVDQKEPRKNLRPTQKIRMEIVTPRLEGIGASGGSEVTADVMSGSDLEIAASGGSEVKVERISGRSLELAASGGSEIRLTGSADTVEIAMSGGSEIHAGRVAAQDVEFAGSGGSVAELQASQSLEATLSGGSAVEVQGRKPAQTAVNASGGSRVSYREG